MSAQDDSMATAAEARKKVKPDQQIYRPGMIRLGRDLTQQAASSNSEHTVERNQRPTSRQNDAKCSTFDNHHRQREDGRQFDSGRHSNRRDKPRHPQQRYSAVSSENVYRPQEQPRDTNRRYYATIERRPDRPDQYRSFNDSLLSQEQRAAPRGNRRRNISYKSVQSERPAPRHDTADDSDAQSVFTDTLSNYGDTAFNDNTLQSQTSQSSLNSVTSSNFLKPSLESLLSQELPSIDWMAEVDRAEEEMKRFQMEQEDEPQTPIAEPNGFKAGKPSFMQKDNRNAREGAVSPASSQSSYKQRSSYSNRNKQKRQEQQQHNEEMHRNRDRRDNRNYRGPQQRSSEEQRKEPYRPRIFQPPSSTSIGPSRPALNTVRMSVLDTRLTRLREEDEVKRVAKQPTAPFGIVTKESSQPDASQLQQYQKQMEQLCAVILRSRDESTANDIRDLSLKMSTLYCSILKRNAQVAFAKQMEQSLWKHSFYSPIESLRSAGNVAREKGKALQNVLLQLIDDALSFYQQLIDYYEKQLFAATLEDILFWPNGLPAASMTDALLQRPTHKKMHEIKQDPQRRFFFESAQRLLLPVGDLHRYKVAVQGVQDYSAARLWYLKASQLHFPNGRCYNQLGLLAVYSVIQRRPLSHLRLKASRTADLSTLWATKLHKQRKWLDVVFFYVRALAVPAPFDSAKQALDSAFHEISKRAIGLKQSVLEKVDADGKLNKAENVENVPVERVREVWFLPDGSTKDGAEETEAFTYEMFYGLPLEELYKATVTHLLHISGLLVTKIGMETLPQFADLALGELMALLSVENTPLTALHLVQITTTLLFCVHNASLRGGDRGMCSALQYTAMQMVLSFWAVLLTIVTKELDKLERMLETGTASSKLSMVLPAISLICEWISTPSVHGIYRTMPTLEGIASRFVATVPWPVLATIANTLAPIHAKKIGRAEPFSIALIPTTCEPPLSEDNPERIALHARIHGILTAAEYLDGSELHCFTYDTILKQFCALHHPTDEAIVESLTPIAKSPKLLKSQNSVVEGQNDVKESLSPEAILMKENILKEKLLAEEQEANRFTMEVRPEYLVVDTNAFVDYLKEIERLINSQKFIILIPTIVIAELKFLSTSARSAATFLPAALDDPSEAHEKYVLEHAKQALTFLRKAADNRSPSFSTVTSKGDRLPNITFAAENLGNTEDKQVNDDHILNACIELSKKKRTATNEAEASSTSPLERSVVLLTEDRALSIKAMAARIPVRTVPKFMKWCGV